MPAGLPDIFPGGLFFCRCKRMNQHKKVLLADNDRDTVKILTKIIKGIDMSPIPVRDAATALTKFKKDLPGIAIIDYHFSDVRGNKLIRIFKDMRPIAQPIAITGYGEYEKAVRALQSGAVDYIKKPFEKTVIEKSVKRASSKFKQLRDTTEICNILLVEGNKDLKSQIENLLTPGFWNIEFCDSYLDCFRILSRCMTDIVIIDFDNGVEQGLELLKKLKLFFDNISVVVMAEKGDEETAVEAMRLGADDYIMKPKDLSRLPEILQNAVKALEIRRISNFKIVDFNSRNDIVAKISRLNIINMELFTEGESKAFSFAKRLLDNVPLCVAVADENKRIIYTNNFFRRNANRVPEKIGEKFISVLQTIGVKDVPLEILDREIDNLTSSGAEIETITLGKNEYLTLTTFNLSLIPHQVFRAVLIVAVGR